MKEKLPYILANLLSLAAGAGLGLCIKVFMTRGVPVTNGGGELLILLAVPASLAAGFLWGRKSRKYRK